LRDVLFTVTLKRTINQSIGRSSSNIGKMTNLIKCEG
jgi:hypothetical protein